LLTGVIDETDLGCADSIIDARFSGDFCSFGWSIAFLLM